MITNANKKNKKPKYPLKRYKNGWNREAKTIASWKLKENPHYEQPKLMIGDDDSWLEEQSLCTDTDIKEALDAKIEDESFLRKLI